MRWLAIGIVLVSGCHWIFPYQAGTDSPEAGTHPETGARPETGDPPADTNAASEWPPTPADGLGESCTINENCKAEEYCLKPPRQCTGSGACAPIPTGICHTNADPVCGCNGRTYNNACLAAREKTSLALNDSPCLDSGLPPRCSQWTDWSPNICTSKECLVTCARESLDYFVHCEYGSCTCSWDTSAPALRYDPPDFNCNLCQTAFMNCPKI